MKKLGSPKSRRWVTVIVTVCLALLSGHLVQTNTPTQAPWNATRTATALPTAPFAPSALNTPMPLRDRILATRAERAGSCLPMLQLEETPTGELGIALEVPCHPRTPFKIMVNTLTADVVTDAKGRWEQRIPGLAPEIAVSIQLGKHTRSERLDLSDRTAKQLVALAWHGPQTFFIRPETAPSGSEEGLGQVIRVGTGIGAAFEVFSSSPGEDRAAGIVRLSVDALVTEENCGKNVSTQAYQTSYLGDLRPTEIAYTMPDCDRVGDVVRLQNLLRDMRLASR